jgi:hypothetical protein
VQGCQGSGLCQCYKIFTATWNITHVDSEGGEVYFRHKANEGLFEEVHTGCLHSNGYSRICLAAVGVYADEQITLDDVHAARI